MIIKSQHHIDPKPHKKTSKKTPEDKELNLRTYRIFEGTDLLAIEA